MNRLTVSDDVVFGADAVPSVLTFLRTPLCAPTASALSDAAPRAAFFGATIDTVGFPVRHGVAFGPAACRLASLQFTGCTTLEYEIDIRDYWRLVDCGNVSLAGGNIANFQTAIADTATEILHAGALPIMCGGDHSIPIPGVEALSRVVDGNIGYIHIDAHLDTHDEAGGTKTSMASPVIRISEYEKVNPRNMVVIGARGAGYPPTELARARSLGVHIIPMFDVIERGIDETIEEALNVAWEGTETIYVSFDNDSMDASHAPGTTAPEPAGFTSREMLRMAAAIGRRGVGMLDIAELSPHYDPAGITARLDCYWIIYVLSAYARAIERGEAMKPTYAQKQDVV